ncbi:MAG: alpha/beta-type small acid-soluble spore protein [Firmicutes bacterium]|nr:alpha/beta-type small acid-soluble spore protein [Bacillota bacterium]
MANDRNSNQLVVQQARAALEQLKFEVAQELGIQIPQDGYYGNMITRDTGRIGGNMVRRMIERAEREMTGEEYAAEWADTPAADRDGYPGLRRPGPDERRRYVERGRRDRRA